MSKSNVALLAAIPLLWSGLAFAQAAPADPSAPPTLPRNMMMRHHAEVDVAAMHKMRCVDGYAHHAAKMAFIEAKLELTDAQRPLFARWRQAVLDSAEKEKTSCLGQAPKGDARPTMVEREAHMENMLYARLQSLQATRPSLQAFYDSLTPAQRTMLDQPQGHAGHGPGPHGRGDEMMQRGPGPQRP